MKDDAREPGSSEYLVDTTASLQRRQCDSGNAPTALRRHGDNIYHLWDELADFGSSANNEALMHCMRGICTMINAQNAFWIGSVRMLSHAQAAGDSLSGWRARCLETLSRERTANPQRMEDAKQHHLGDPGETTRIMLSGVGQFRMYSLGTGIVDLEAFKKTDHYDFFYRQPGIADRIWVVFPVNADTESIFLFDTYDTGRFFSAKELFMAAEALRGIKWFHRQLLLNSGVGICATALAPAERRVIPLLLSGAAEKSIAEQLQLTKATVHQYVTTVYRKFGVRGRTEFMAVWLRGRL